jgi:hypothetical protein
VPVVLYGCETWSVTLREGHRLRVFGNRVLRGIFGPKRDEVTGEWRKLHSGELHNLYSFPNISSRMRWAGHVARMKNCTGFWCESPKNEEHPDDRGVDGRMALVWVSGRLVGGCGVD